MFGVPQKNDQVICVQKVRDSESCLCVTYKKNQILVTTFTADVVLYNCICVIFVSVMDLAQCCRDSNPPVLAGNLPFSAIISGLLFSFNILLFFVTFFWQRKIMCSLLHQCSP